MDIYSVFKESFNSFSFIPDDAVILVAFSGGRDSTALLRLFMKLSEERKLTVWAAYINHGIRSDAAAEEEWVRAHCLALGLPLMVERTDIPGLLKAEGGNLEELASRERYQLLSRCLSKLPQPAFLATAHHAGDQLETFLFRLARGSGPQGMLGISAHIEQRIVRPLLAVTPFEIDRYVMEHQLAFYRDSSNDDMQYSRNRIRRKVLPELETISDGLYSGFIRAQKLLGEEDAFLQEQAVAALARIQPVSGVLQRRGLKVMHPALARRVLRLFVTEIRGNLRAITFGHLDGLHRAIQCEETGYHLPGVTLDLGRNWVVHRGLNPQGYEFPLHREQKTLRMHCPAAQLNVRTLKSLKIDATQLTVIVPEHKLIYPLTVRSLKAGDRYRKIHTGFQQKVTEMLRERGIPNGLRFLFPLLVNGDGRPIWCFSCPLAADFHISRSQKEDEKLLRFSWKNHPFERFLIEK